MSLADDTRWMDATDQAALVAGGQASVAELVEAAIERIEALDGPINAVVIRWFDHARDLAVRGDLPDGPFRGVPFLLKDLWAAYEGQVLSNGNVALRDAQPVSPADTTIVSRFRDAGLVTLGRTNSPELGSVPVTEPVAYGPTRNPWDTDRVPGGSSGGAAAAVAAGMVPIAHASDGGGSIRIPAACCGLIGLKTSQGRITVGPYRTESGLGVELCVSRSVRDTAALLDAVHGPGVGDTVIAPPPSRPYIDEIGADPGRLRIGLLDHHPRGGAVHDDCVAAVRTTASMLEALGHSVEPGFPAPLADESFTQRFMAIWSTNMAVGLEAYGEAIGRPLVEHEVEPVNWAQAQFAHKVSGVDHAKALAATAEFRRATQQWWADGFDLLLTPTLAEPPVRIGEHDPVDGDPMAGMRRAAAWVPFTPPFNVSGQPAINVPLHWNDAGLPIGVQLVAAYGREDLLIRVASQLEAAHAWAQRTPPAADSPA
ncbi:MAG: amidase [Ilumatobacter sp.]|uniref:amidase n=1 Tax=Ilumatobacter sp. TaxID=1967498 RepID=UPI0026023146|nr:amidase [Ilumatobacter sp.]MDJ0769998.1 amidase [Ilumatobacter sp.]